MKHIKKWIPVLAVLALTLAACSGGGNQKTPTASGVGTSSVPSTGGTAASTSSVPSTGATSALPTTAGTSMVSPSAAATSGVSSTMAATTAPMATSAATSVTGATTAATSVTGGVSPTTAATSSVAATSPATSNVVPIIPSTGTGAGQIVSLAAMLKYRVVDNSGAAIGTVSDYVVNVCEAHLVYAVVTPDTSLNVQGGKQMLIPYEAFFATPNSGKIDAGSGVLTLKVAASSLSSAPTVDVTTLDMQNPTWDTNIMAYWRQNFRLSLTTGCRIPAAGTVGTPGVSGTVVPSGSSAGTAAPNGAVSTVQSGTSGTTVAGAAPTYSITKVPNRQDVFRIGLASKILGAALQEGNGTTIGQDADVGILVQTGGIIYYIIQPTNGVQSTLGTAMPNTGTSMPQGTSVPNTGVGTAAATMSSSGAGTVSPTMGTGSTSSGVVANTGSGRLVALPPAAVNIRYANNANGQFGPALVLLAQTNVFLQAPAFNAQSGTNDSSWFNYWQKYVPMTQSEVP